MWSFSLLLPVLLASTASAGVDLNEMCGKLDGVVGSCTGTYQYPISAVAKNCTSGGTTKTCGVSIVTELRYLCNAVRDGMPDNNDGDKFIRESKGICNYLPAMNLLSNDESLRNMFDNGDVSSASNATLVDKIHNIDKGIRVAKLAIGDNRSSVIANLAADGGPGYSVVRAADANLEVYNSFRMSINSCYNGSGCDHEQIGIFFANYINNSNDMLDGELYKLFRTWLDLFELIQQKIAAVKAASKRVQAHLKIASTEVSSINNSACQNSACNGRIATNFLKQVSDSLSMFKALDATTSGADRGYKAVTPTRNLIYEAIRGLVYTPDNQFLSNLIHDGDILEIGNIILGFRIAKEMPKISVKMKKEIIPIILLTRFSTKGSAASKSLDTVLATDWNNKMELFGTEAALKVRDGFISIQSTMENKLREPLNTLRNEIKGLDNALNKFQLRKKNLDWYSGSVPYTRYTANAINLPCKSTFTKTYNVEGYTGSYTYPIFEPCLYGPELIYLPNYHIPYIRWGFIAPP